MGQDKPKTVPHLGATPSKAEGDDLPTVPQVNRVRRPSLLEVFAAVAIAIATALSIVLTYNPYSLLTPLLTLGVVLSLCFPFWWEYPQTAIWSQFPIITVRWILAILVVLMIVGSSYWEYRLMSIVTGLPRYLIAADDPYFEDDCSENVPAGALLLYLGKSTAFIPTGHEESSSDSAKVVLLTANQPALTLERAGSGLYVTANVMSPDGKFVVKIERNKLINHPNNSAYLIRSETSTLAIYDEHDQEVFYVRYMNSFAVRIRGVFGFPGKHTLIVTDEEMAIPALNQHIPKMCIGSISGGYRF